MVRCRKCRIDKCENDFYRSDKNNCKDCKKEASRSYREINIEKVRLYDRERGQFPHRKEANKTRASRYANDNHKKEWINRNRKKRKAHEIVSNSLRDGLLIRPEICERCHTECKPEAHHEDYSKPLEIVWLCKTCHGERHRELNELKRAA